MFYSEVVLPWFKNPVATGISIAFIPIPTHPLTALMCFAQIKRRQYHVSTQ